MGFSQEKPMFDNCSKKGKIFNSLTSMNQNIAFDSVCLDNKKNKIYRNSSYTIILKENSNKRKYKKESVFAFFDGLNTYRFYQSEEKNNPIGYFKIENLDGLIIYSQIQYTSTKYSSWTSIKFFYSLTLESPIKSLNNKNISSDFNNIGFQNEVFKKIESLKNINFQNYVPVLFDIQKIYGTYY